MARTSLSGELAEVRVMVREQTKANRKNNLKSARRIGETFYTGDIHISPGVEKLGLTIDSPELDEAFGRYLDCDWGGCEEDADINEATMKSGYGNIMGSYNINGAEIWIVTDTEDGTRTTILLPTEW